MRYSFIKQQYVFNQNGRKFLHAPWAGGVVLLVCVVIAMLLANLPCTADLYRELLHTDLSIFFGIGHGAERVEGFFPHHMNVEKIINDGLMVVFFFSVGLEIKHELTHGQLSSVKKALLPVIAAAGGMLVPGILYAIFNMGTEAANGWAIPTATDIAFAIGIMSLLGNRVPISLKVFLTALAIADDLGAIIVIALFYGETPNLLLISIAAILMGIVYLMNRMGEYRMRAYMFMAVIIWTLFYYSGIHATLSGVAMAMLIPARPRYSKSYFLHKANALEALIVSANRRIKDQMISDDTYHHLLRRMKRLANRSMDMSSQLEHELAPYINFVVMPIFALANAGVAIDSVEYFNIFQHSPEVGSIGMGIFFGLVLGKPIGITLLSFLAVKCGIAEQPANSSWKMLFAVACLGGIGFTMSIFVDSLAFDPVAHGDLISKGKIAILISSVAAGVLGSLLIMLFAKNKQQAEC